MLSLAKAQLTNWSGAKGFLFRQTLFLFGVDLLTNVVDYIFHIYLGRVLIPGDFAIFQTVNSALVVLVTAFGVFQPVVARFVAEAEGKVGVQNAIFQEYFRWGIGIGLGCAGVIWAGQNVLSEWLNVPPLAVAVGAGVVLLSFSRPVVWGMLQGQQKFFAFGVTRLTYALGRFVVAIGLIGLGWAAMGAVIALPAGTLLSLTVGVAILWHSFVPIFSPAEKKETHQTSRFAAGLRLAGFSFVAYAAHTTLLNLDMVWVNRFFSPDEAGIYAGAVLLRKILFLLPGVVVVVFYPRVVAVLAKRQLPDRLLAISMAILVGIVLIVTVIYFVAGGWIVQVVFGGEFAPAGALLGWMGIGVIGFSIGTLWMNLALATRPMPFVGILIGTVAMQVLGFIGFAGTLPGVVGVFVLAGWSLAIGGGVIYGFWLRPRLVSQFKELR